MSHRILFLINLLLSLNFLQTSAHSKSDTDEVAHASTVRLHLFE